MNADLNPLLIKEGFPAYDRILPEHIGSAVEEFLGRCREILRKVESSAETSWSALMEPLEEIDLLFEYGWSPIGHLLSVANSDELRVAHDASMPKVVEFGLQIRQSEAIFRSCGLFATPQTGVLSQALSSALSLA
jgi:oligopeptidase A